MKVVENLPSSAVTVINAVQPTVKMTRVILKMELVLILNLYGLIHTALLHIFQLISSLIFYFYLFILNKNIFNPEITLFENE